MHIPSAALTGLNDDVLVKIFEELRPEEGLRDLSSTCRWLRAASAPILFRSCRQYLGDTPWDGKTYEFLPSALWSHVRTLHISCFCPPYSQRDPDVVDPLLCDAISTFDAVLPSLPRLTTLHLDVQYIDVHGLSWKTMQKILSLPQLDHLHIHGLYICPALLADDSPTDFTVTSLTTFHYTMPPYRHPWSFPSEMSTLDTLIRKLHASLESLVLPVESAPIQTISSLPWPRLREFTLQGERWSNPAIPIVTLFSSMPFLRSLALELSEPENASAGVIWPTGHPATLPWPDLESLRVSHPNSTDDSIYASLPPSLRGLALRSWPHECTRIYQQLARYGSTSLFEGYKRRSWSYPLSTPHNLVQVLRQCDLPLLRSLELEYRTDAEEPELLQLVTAKFPHLTTLEIHRFRSERREEVPVKDLATALAPLASLRTLKLHLNFPHMPAPNFGGRGAPGRSVLVDDPRIFDDTLAATSEQLSRALAPSLEQIWMYTFKSDPMWVIFHVTRIFCDGELHIGAVRSLKDRQWY